nr:hypothetical protein [Bacillus sp. Marseille-Q3570]
MCSLVLSFQEMEKTQLSLVDGKGLNLGELSKNLIEISAVIGNIQNTEWSIVTSCISNFL